MKRDMRMNNQLQRRMGRGPGNRGMGSQEDAVNLNNNMRRSIPKHLMPGNVGDINRVIWPFWFTFSSPEVTPNQTSQASLSISQEAAFIWMAFSKVVYKKTGAQYVAIDPAQEATADGEANGLNFQFRDAQSSRVFSQTVLPLDAFGDPNFPSVLQTPIMFLPNSTVECVYSNSDATATYVPFITLFGYRVRLEDAQKIMSLVHG